MESVVEAKYKAGTAGYVDLIKIQIEKDKLLDRLRSAREMIAPLKIKLNALLNRDPGGPLPLPRYQQISSASYIKNQLIKWLKESNPELKSLDFNRKKASIQIKLARKGYFPDFSVGLDYIMTDEAIMTGVEESGKDPIVAMVQLSIPLWFSKNRARVNQAKFNLENVLNQKKEKENSLLANLEMVYYKFRDKEKKIKLYRENLLPQARQAIEVVLAAYKTGSTDILNFMDSQQTLLDLELKHEYTLSAYARSQAELEMLVGRVLF
jgi:outer membrane protein TolC